jgi:hypothetical protein
VGSPRIDKDELQTRLAEVEVTKCGVAAPWGVPPIPVSSGKGRLDKLDAKLDSLEASIKASGAPYGVAAMLVKPPMPQRLDKVEARIPQINAAVAATKAGLATILPVPIIVP